MIGLGGVVKPEIAKPGFRTVDKSNVSDLPSKSAVQWQVVVFPFVPVTPMVNNSRVGWS